MNNNVVLCSLGELPYCVSDLVCLLCVMSMHVMELSSSHVALTIRHTHTASCPCWENSSHRCSHPEKTPPFLSLDLFSFLVLFPPFFPLFWFVYEVTVVHVFHWWFDGQCPHFHPNKFFPYLCLVPSSCCILVSVGRALFLLPWWITSLTNKTMLCFPVKGKNNITFSVRTKPDIHVLRPEPVKQAKILQKNHLHDISFLSHQGCSCTTCFWWVNNN